MPISFRSRSSTDMYSLFMSNGNALARNILSAIMCVLPSGSFSVRRAGAFSARSFSSPSFAAPFASDSSFFSPRSPFGASDALFSSSVPSSAISTTASIPMNPFFSVIRQLSPPRYTILAISPKTDCVRTILSLFCSSIKYTRAFVLRKLPFSVRSGALSLPLRRAQAAEKKRSPVFG